MSVWIGATAAACRSASQSRVHGSAGTGPGRGGGGRILRILKAMKLASGSVGVAVADPERGVEGGGAAS